MNGAKAGKNYNYMNQQSGHVFLDVASRVARLVLVFLVTSLFSSTVEGKPRVAVVADSLTRLPLSNASVFDRKGRFAGTTNSKAPTLMGLTA